MRSVAYRADTGTAPGRPYDAAFWSILPRLAANCSSDETNVTQPSPSRPTRLKPVSFRSAAIQMGIPGRCTGLGRTPISSNRKYRPS